MITVIYTQYVCSKCMVFYFSYENLTQGEELRYYHLLLLFLHECKYCYNIVKVEDWTLYCQLTL